MSELPGSGRFWKQSQRIRRVSAGRLALASWSLLGPAHSGQREGDADKLPPHRKRPFRTNNDNQPPRSPSNNTPYVCSFPPQIYLIVK